MKPNYMMKEKRKAENNELRRLFLCGSLMSQMILTEQTDVKGIALQWKDQIKKVRKSGLLDKL
jgi:hypothetical protein